MPYHLIDANGGSVTSDTPGLLGGNRRLKIYGRLDCPSARRALARGYARRRVFFADEATAVAAGYRPCAVCMPAEYRRWKDVSATPRTSVVRRGVAVAGVIALWLGVARVAHGQGGTGRLEGTVTDSIHARPLAGARVAVVDADSPAGMLHDATTGPNGAFRIDSLAPGRYLVGFESPLLDSLEIAMSPREVTIAPHGTATIALAVPSPAKLRAAVCPGVALPPETGVVFGRVVSAETEKPLAGATIVTGWNERAIDRTTLRPIDHDRTVSATTGAAGWYAVCGVPIGTFLSIQLQHERRVGPVLRVLVDDTLGIAVRHLSFSASGTRRVPDSITVGDDEVLGGTASLTGTVLGVGDVPLPAAELRVRGTSRSARTDDAGRFSLTNLPAGTQVLEVRHVGYSAEDAPVELRSNTTRTMDMRLSRVVNLDSIRVVARRSRYPRFEDHRQYMMFGRFLGPEELARQPATYTSDIVQAIPGFHVVGYGFRATVVSSRGSGTCRTNVVIDGAENRAINEVSPGDIGAIEAYREGDMAPDSFDRGCGAIVIWTKR